MAEASGRVSDYVYDHLHRLTSESATDAAHGNCAASYQYDAIGNRTLSLIDGVTTLYQYDDNDRLTQQGGTTYAYDNQGNTQSETLDGNTSSYSYDQCQRMVQVNTPGSLISYAYDIGGVCNAKTESGVTTDFLVDQNRSYAPVLVPERTHTLINIDTDQTGILSP
ncbi:MAG: YD repeat-containing protein [Gammaproteobacteria bacterium]|jgi:YD repeat-containing protein